MYAQPWGSAVGGSVVGLWGRTINFLPSLFGAIVVFVIGILLAAFLGTLTSKVLKKLKVDKASEEIGLAKLLAEGGIETGIAEILGAIVKWFLIIAFLMAATDILNLPQITAFLNSVLLYLPNVAVAIIILAITIILANFVEKIVAKSTKTAKLAYAGLLKGLSKWSILIFGIMAALMQLGIAKSLISILFSGIIGMLALAGGLAFGLGGKEKAAEFLDKISKK